MATRESRALINTQTYGSIPKARDDHSAVCDGASAFYIFGGFTGNLKNNELWRFSLDS